jgi:hypothetical protein
MQSLKINKIHNTPPLIKGVRGIFKITILFSMLLIVSFTNGYSQENVANENEFNLKQGELSLGLGYPYGSIRYGGEKVAGEFKAAFGSGIQLYAGRLYWHFLNTDSLRLFTGGEFGYIKLSGTYDLSGSGWEFGVFAGIETFITNWLSIALDFSPTYISLESNNVGVDGIEYVVNLAIYVFPFGNNKRSVLQSKTKVENKHIVVDKRNQKNKKADSDLSSFAKETKSVKNAKQIKQIPKTKETNQIILTEDLTNT